MDISNAIEILKAARQNQVIEYRIKGTMMWSVKENIFDSNGSLLLDFNSEDYSAV